MLLSICGVACELERFFFVVVVGVDVSGDGVGSWILGCGAVRERGLVFLCERVDGEEEEDEVSGEGAAAVTRVAVWDPSVDPMRDPNRDGGGSMVRGEV